MLGQLLMFLDVVGDNITFTNIVNKKTTSAEDCKGDYTIQTSIEPYVALQQQFYCMSATQWFKLWIGLCVKRIVLQEWERTECTARVFHSRETSFTHFHGK
jgi:hypothetical protein